MQGCGAGGLQGCGRNVGAGGIQGCVREREEFTGVGFRGGGSTPGHHDNDLQPSGISVVE